MVRGTLQKFEVCNQALCARCVGLPRNQQLSPTQVFAPAKFRNEPIRGVDWAHDDH